MLLFLTSCAMVEMTQGIALAETRAVPSLRRKCVKEISIRHLKRLSARGGGQFREASSCLGSRKQVVGNGRRGIAAKYLIASFLWPKTICAPLLCLHGHCTPLHPTSYRRLITDRGGRELLTTTSSKIPLLLLRARAEKKTFLSPWST